mgnify:CR=1 FL=1
MLINECVLTIFTKIIFLDKLDIPLGIYSILIAVVPTFNGTTLLVKSEFTFPLYNKLLLLVSTNVTVPLLASSVLTMKSIYDAFVGAWIVKDDKCSVNFEYW